MAEPPHRKATTLLCSLSVDVIRQYIEDQGEKKRPWKEKKPGNIISVSNSSLNVWRRANTNVREYWIVDPQRERIFVYHLEQENFEVETYTFKDCIPVGIYPDLQIDFASLDL